MRALPLLGLLLFLGGASAQLPLPSTTPTVEAPSVDPNETLDEVPDLTEPTPTQPSPTATTTPSPTPSSSPTPTSGPTSTTRPRTAIPRPANHSGAEGSNATNATLAEAVGRESDEAPLAAPSGAAPDAFSPNPATTFAQEGTKRAPWAALPLLLAGLGAAAVLRGRR